MDAMALARRQYGVMTSPAAEARIDRISSSDLMELATETTAPSIQVAAILTIGGSPQPHQIRKALRRRCVTIGRLRQRLVRAPFGAGRPIWIDDTAFDIDDHVTTQTIPNADQASLLRAAASIVQRPLDPKHPLWSATLLRDGAGHCAIVFVFHHVLMDGVGGLAVLAALMDGAQPPDSVPFPRPQPDAGRLYRDAWVERWRSLERLPAVISALANGLHDLQPDRSDVRRPRSLNIPIGVLRRVDVVAVSLDQIHRAASHFDTTINDALLAAIGGVMGTILDRRGDSADHIVASVPVSQNQHAEIAKLSNNVGVMPVIVPLRGTMNQRLFEVHRRTARQKQIRRGGSATVLSSAFRLLARTGAFEAFINHQHLVDTFVSNVRGPAQIVSFLGTPVTSIVPLTPLSGNIPVAFTALSYAGRLVVSVVSDPEQFPEGEQLAALLSDELGGLIDRAR